MTQLGLGIPTKYLKHFTIFTDFDFALAHKVLENEDYRNFYKTQSNKGRVVFLDNSLIELGSPMKPEDILQAGALIRATHIVAPDKFEDPLWSMEQALNFKIQFGAYHLIIGACHGDVIQQQNILKIYQKHNIIPALSFREDRSWYRSELHGPVHFFGFKSVDQILEGRPRTIDTNYPIRLGMARLPLTNQVREGPELYLPPFDFDATMDIDQLKQAVINCWLLKVNLWNS